MTFTHTLKNDGALQFGKVKIKHIEIFTETYKGYSMIEVYGAKLTFKPAPPVGWEKWFEN
ncbi:MAG: hypothetical protein ACUVTE_04480 [Candidatus Bathycorpusculaceae bacterium]